VAQEGHGDADDREHQLVEVLDEQEGDHPVRPAAGRTRVNPLFA